MYEELKELKELLDMGAITQEEFDAKKTELLSVAFNEKDLTNPAVPSSTSDSLTQQKSKMAAPPITSDTVTQNNKNGASWLLVALGWAIIIWFVFFCFSSCSDNHSSSTSYSSSSQSYSSEREKDDALKDELRKYSYDENGHLHKEGEY
mgnify:CR=1 FL=1